MTKEHILKEIRRTAHANGGVALGEARFHSETGIKKFDWFGVYWSRWSDAASEAGVTPNKFQGAFEDAKVLDRYARLASELGRLPSSGDLRLARRGESTFPSHHVFSKFGTKSELLRKIIEYCNNRNEYEAVARLCEEYLLKSPEGAEPSEPQEEEIGSVYLIKSGKFYKIGKTNAVGRREYELVLQLPEKPKLVHEIRTDDSTGIEAYWHNRFAAKRKNGEWFDLNAADIGAFKRRKFM